MRLLEATMTDRYTVVRCNGVALVLLCQHTAETLLLLSPVQCSRTWAWTDMSANFDDGDYNNRKRHLLYPFNQILTSSNITYMSRLRAGGREARRPWWCSSPPVPPTAPRTPPPRTAHGSSASYLHIPTLKPQLGTNLGFLSNSSMWLVSVGALWCNCGASIV